MNARTLLILSYAAAAAGASLRHAGVPEVGNAYYLFASLTYIAAIVKAGGHR